MFNSSDVTEHISIYLKYLCTVYVYKELKFDAQCEGFQLFLKHVDIEAS